MAVLKNFRSYSSESNIKILDIMNKLGVSMPANPNKITYGLKFINESQLEVEMAKTKKN